MTEQGIPIHGVDPTRLAEIMELAELAESNPHYRLAVVDACPKPDFAVVKGANGALHAAGIALGQEAMWDNNYRKVVKMEER